jgi:hypothetical protein
MSRIAFNGNALGTGTLTIASPNTNSDQTLTLPDSTGTVLLNGGAASFSTLTVNSNNISAVNSMGFRNRIINGDMRIDQRNAGASLTPTNEQYTLDRWQAWRSQASKYSVQQNAGSVTPPAGFSNYLGVTSLSAYSIAVSDYFMVSQKVEGFNASDFAWGTASAQAVTLSFWVRSSLTGTFGGSAQNSAQNRSYPFTYTISAANTWEQKTVSIAGDTSGIWLSTNGVGLYLWFGLGVGSNFSGTAGAWNANNNFSATGATSVVGTNGATWQITGVQLEAGSVATPFERRAYGQELVLCLRYYWKLYSGGTTAPFSSGNAENTTRGYINLTLPQPMRTQPTCSISSLTHLALRGGGTNVTCTAGSFVPSVASAMATIIGGEFDVGSSTSASTGGCVKMCFVNAAGWIDASAEL